MALMATFTLAAQPPGRPEGNRLEFLAGYLGLTEAQKTQAAEIFSAERAATETLRGQMTSAHDALQAAVKANKPEAELEQLAAAVGTLHGRIAAAHAKAQAKFYNLLTAEQKAKLDQMGDRVRGRFGPQGRRPPFRE